MEKELEIIRMSKEIKKNMFVLIKLRHFGIIYKLEIQYMNEDIKFFLKNILLFKKAIFLP